MASTASAVLIGTHTIPAFWMPSIATTIWIELLHSMPTRSPLKRPRPSRWCAKRFDAASSSL